MKAVVQRVQHGSVVADGRQIASIGRGLVILLGVGPGDNEETARSLARKLAMMRIFEDEQGKMNLSCLDVGGEALVVSQFTLYADTRKGNRPSFTGCAAPEIAQPLCDYFTACLVALGLPSQTGEFGAHMQVEITNDGPVTIVVEM